MNENTNVKLSKQEEWWDHYRRYEQKALDAGRIQMEPERSQAFKECQAIYEELMSSPDKPKDGPSRIQINSRKQLLAWCDDAKPDELFPFDLRHVRDAAIKLGVRVKLPTMPEIEGFIDIGNDKFLDLWVNTVFDFIESIQIAVQELVPSGLEPDEDPEPSPDDGKSEITVAGANKEESALIVRIKSHPAYDKDKQDCVDFKNVPNSWRVFSSNTELKYGKTVTCNYAAATGQLPFEKANSGRPPGN